MPNDRFRFLGRARQAEKPPIVAELTTKTDGTVATMRLYDAIDSWGGSWGVSAKEFTDALDQLGSQVDEIRLHINSPGGEVFEGIAILNALRAHKARVVAVVDGLAASAASFVAAGADELVMARNSELMIHEAWGVCVGNAEDMRSLANRLDQLGDNIASIYAAKAGTDVAEWRAAMHAETWYSAQEAVDAGLADRLDDATADEHAKNRFDLSVFAYAGRQAAPPPPPMAAPDPSPAPADEPAAAGGAPVQARHAVIATDLLGEDIAHDLHLSKETPA